MSTFLRFLAAVAWFAAISFLSWLLAPKAADLFAVGDLASRCLVAAPLILASMGVFVLVVRMSRIASEKARREAGTAAVLTALYISMQLDPASWSASWSSDFWLKARFLLPYVAGAIVLTPLFYRLAAAARRG